VNGTITKLTVPAWALRTSIIRSGHFTAGQFAWLFVPGVSKLSWHPFTISSPPSVAESNGLVTFHIKAMGPGTWTQKLAQHVSALVSDTPADSSINAANTPLLISPPAAVSSVAAVPLALTVDGPYGRPWDFTNRKAMVFFAGGIGITPMFSMLTEVLLRGAEAALPAAFNSPDNEPHQVQAQEVRLVWCVREVSLLLEFASMLFHLVDRTLLAVSVSFYCPCLFQAIHGGAGSIPSALQGVQPALAQWIMQHTIGHRPNFSKQLSQLAVDHSAGDRYAGPSDKRLVLACGPSSLVDAASGAASLAGWDFHFEEFMW
jgi:ferredoxin-NADP reductase